MRRDRIDKEFPHIARSKCDKALCLLRLVRKAIEFGVLGVRLLNDTAHLLIKAALCKRQTIKNNHLAVVATSLQCTEWVIVVSSGIPRSLMQ